MHDEINSSRGRLIEQIQYFSVHVCLGIQSNHSDLYCIGCFKICFNLCQRTPLHVAVEEGQECTVETLVEKYGANINFKNKDGVSEGPVFTTFAICNL